MDDDWNYPYSPVKTGGGLLFVSGCLPWHPDGFIEVDEQHAMECALDVLADRLEAVGSSLAEVVKVTYFVTDLSLRDRANDQFVARWNSPRPARSVIGVASLPHGATVEIEAIATATPVVPVR